MVAEPKKNFYKKFLHEPFPVESSLHKKIHDHINAEIASGTLGDYAVNCVSGYVINFLTSFRDRFVDLICVLCLYACLCMLVCILTCVFLYLFMYVFTVFINALFY